MKRRFCFQTPLVPNFTLPATPESKQEAANLWHKIYVEAKLPAECFSMNWRPQESGLYNPEYLVLDWSNCILNQDRLENDVFGWAGHALEREQEFCLKQLSVEERAKRIGWKPEHAISLKRRSPLPVEMLMESQARYFLTRFKEWMDARLAYHRLALRLTFYKDDPLASREPICSDAEKLRMRFADWREIRIRQQQELFEKYVKSQDGQLPPKQSELYGVDFVCWMKDHGAESKAISWEAINWLCWLQLTAPLSKDWEPHQAAKAVRKMFLGERFRRDATKWWSAPPKLTYEPPDEGDDWPARMAKETVSNEFNDFVEDYVNNELADLKSFTNTLTRQLNEYGIPHHRRRGKPRKFVEEVPDAWERGDVVELAKALRSIATGQEHKGKFNPESALSDLEKDDPQGWLAAYHVTF